MKKRFFLVLFLIFKTSLIAQEVFVIDTSKQKNDKIALVILNGFGDSKKNRKKQKQFFENQGYDLYIPEYIKRKSIENSIESFTLFFNKHELDRYKEVKFLCYIIGGYVLNKHIESNGRMNISTIIYDRSPIQERAPKTAVKRLPIISRLMYGNVLKDFSKKEKESLSCDDGLYIGVIVENKATKLMRFFQKTANRFGPYNYNASEMEPNLDDYIHTYLDHDLMYTRFDVIGEEIIHFLENGSFTFDAKRTPYDWDPFKKLTKNDIDL